MSVFIKRYGIVVLLALSWVGMAVWQAAEHHRFLAATRAGLVSRAQDTAAALSVVIRSQGRFGLAPQSRITAALRELVDSTELISVALLNAANEVVASAGRPMTADMALLMDTREVWTRDEATFLTLVALGPDAGSASREPAAPSVVIDTEDRPPQEPPPPEEPYERNWEPGYMPTPVQERMHQGPLTESDALELLAFFPQEVLSPEKRESCLRLLTGQTLTPTLWKHVAAVAWAGRPMPPPNGDGPPPGPPPDHRNFPGRGRDEMRGPRPGPPPGPPHPDRGRPPEFGGPPHGPMDNDAPRRPPWMRQPEFDRLVEARGVHWFVVTMPTRAVHAAVAADLRLRILATAAALAACLVLVWSWRVFLRSADLRVQLARAETLARHLRELNLAAAGLVHETKNPLNIIRGLAQSVSQRTALPESVRDITLKITEESDRVTERLNRFLDYSRPNTPVLSPVSLRQTIASMLDILDTDREDRRVSFLADLPDVHLLADPDMFRQVLFNLLLNALEAAPAESAIAIQASVNRQELQLDIRDEGPGVPAALREEIFRPYYTTTAHGAGLGLAVVRQIALAHGWDVACISASCGACFRISHMCLALNLESGK